MQFWLVLKVMILLVSVFSVLSSQSIAMAQELVEPSVPDPLVFPLENPNEFKDGIIGGLGNGTIDPTRSGEKVEHYDIKGKIYTKGKIGVPVRGHVTIINSASEENQGYPCVFRVYLTSWVFLDMVFYVDIAYYNEEDKVNEKTCMGDNIEDSHTIKIKVYKNGKVVWQISDHR